MAGGIDTSKRKPRRLRGTPAASTVNKYAFLFLLGASAIGVALA